MHGYQSSTSLADKQVMKHLILVTAVVMLGASALADEFIDYGKQIAEANCQQCHAILTDDESRHPEAPRLRELSERYPIDTLEEAFAEGIYAGHPDMPQFEASPEQIGALLAYINSIQARN